MTDRVLLVEDDQSLGQQVVGHLEEAGFTVTWLRDGDDARDVDPDEFRLVVLDLMLPGTYGMDLLKRYRAVSQVPVMVLSARNETTDKVRALSLGADDYVTKPFWPEELVARVEARIRRPQLQQDDRLVVGALVIDEGARTARVGERDLGLTPAELAVLSALARRPGAAVSRASLVDAALDPERPGAERALDVHVSRLRKKLGEDGPTIATVWGIGYRLEG